MLEIFIGSLLLSIIHAAIPNHWVTIVLIGKAEKWTLREVQVATVVTGFAHISSTILLGIIIGLIGLQLSENFNLMSEIIAPVIIIFMGLIYFAINTKHQHIQTDKLLQKKSKSSILTTLSIAMFLSPCLEIETYFLAAGTTGLTGIFIISLVYMFTTLSGMVLLVTLGFKSLQKYNWHFLEHHEKKIIGSVLILVGIMSFFIKI